MIEKTVCHRCGSTWKVTTFAPEEGDGREKPDTKTVYTAHDSELDCIVRLRSRIDDIEEILRIRR